MNITMNKEAFQTFIEAHQQEVTQIRNAACALHLSVGQTYDHTLPYGYHLCMVADAAIAYGHVPITTTASKMPDCPITTCANWPPTS